MNKLRNIVMLGVSGLVLGACADDTTATEQTSSAAEETSVETASSEVASSEVTEKSDVGKRSNPVPFGETGTFETFTYDNDANEINGNLSVTLSNVVRGEEAYNNLLAANEFNEAAPEGQEWLTFDADMVYNSDNQDEPYLLSSFVPVDSTGAEVQQSTYAFTGSEVIATEIYAGGETKGSFAVLVPVGEDVILKYTDGMSDMFFNAK